MRLCQPNAPPPPLRTGRLSRPLSRCCPREMSHRTHDLREADRANALSREARSPLALDAKRKRDSFTSSQTHSF